MSDRRESSGKGKKKEPSLLQRLGVVDSPPSSPSVSSDHSTERSDQSETPAEATTTSAPVFSYADAISSESSLTTREAEATDSVQVIQQPATEDVVPPVITTPQSKLRQSSITADVAGAEAADIMGPTADLTSGPTESPSPTPEVEQARPQPIMFVSEGDIAPPALFRTKLQPQSQPEQVPATVPLAAGEDKETEPQRPWGVKTVVEEKNTAASQDSKIEESLVSPFMFDAQDEDKAKNTDQVNDNIASVPFLFGTNSESGVSTGDQAAEKQADSEIIPFTFGTDSSSDSELASDAASTPEMIRAERKDSITSAKSINSQGFSASVQSDKGLDVASTTAQYGSESIGEESLAERRMSDSQEEQRRASTTAQYGSESIGEESLAERKLSNSTHDRLPSSTNNPESTIPEESRKESLFSTVSSIKTLAALDLEDEVAADEIEMRRRSSGILSGVSKVRRLSTSSIHSVHSISKQSIKEESPERTETITTSTAGDGAIRKDILASSRRSSTASGRVAAAIAAFESSPKGQSEANKQSGVIVERKRSIDSLQSSSPSSVPSTKSQTDQNITVATKAEPSSSSSNASVRGSDVSALSSSSSSNASVRGSDVAQDEALLEPCPSETAIADSKTRKESIQETLASELGDVNQNEGKTVEQVLSVVTSVANRNSSVIEQTTVKDVQGKDVVVVVVVPSADAKATPTSTVKEAAKPTVQDAAAGEKDESKKDGWMKKVAGWMHLNKDKDQDKEKDKDKEMTVKNADVGPTPKSSIAIVDTPTEGAETSVKSKSKDKPKAKSTDAPKAKAVHDAVDPLNVNTYPKDGSLPTSEESKMHHKASKKEPKKTKPPVPIAVSPGSTPSFSGSEIDLESQTSQKLKKKKEGFQYRSWYTPVLIIFFVTVSCIAFMYAMGILYR